MKTALLLATLVLVVSGRSIDNPAETPDRPSGMKQAVPFVEGSNRNGKSLAVPPPVQVSSGVVTVLGSAREGRVIEIGEDGIPIIHGVRVPDDPNDTQIYRNARIVNNKLVTAEEEKENQVEGRSLSSHSEEAILPRQARILTRGSPSPSAGQQGRFPSQIRTSSRPAFSSTFPAFYYKKYFNNERVGVIAESSFEEDNIPTSSEQVVSYSYLAAPEGNSRFDGTSSKDVVYGTGSLAKPPAQSASGVQFFESVKTPVKTVARTPAKTPVPQKNLAKAAALQSQVADPKSSSSEGFEPSPVFGASSSLSSSISNAIPFGHSPESFAVHQVPSASEPEIAHQQVYHPPHAPPTVFQSNPGDFVIQDTTFQAHPGAPTFSLPIPIPTQQTKRRRRPHVANHLRTQASSEAQDYAVAASGETLSYLSYDPSFQDVSTKKPIYQKMIEPFMKAGEQIYKMASPVLDPMFNAGQRISQRLRIPERVSDASDFFSLDSMNSYISRTDGGAFPVAAGVAAVAALGIAALAAASNTNITLGKRSIDDPREEFLYQVLDPYPMGEPTLLDRLEKYTSWADSKCSKRIFCDVMTNVGDDQLYTIEKRLDMFLRMLNRGNAEESALKRTADDVMQAVRRRRCDVFSCGGSEVDSSQVSRLSSGPR